MYDISRQILTLSLLNLANSNFITVPLNRKPNVVGSDGITKETINDRLKWSWQITDLTWNDDPYTSQVDEYVFMKILTMTATISGNDFKDGNYYQAYAQFPSTQSD